MSERSNTLRAHNMVVDSHHCTRSEATSAACCIASEKAASDLDMSMVSL